jgi:Ca2+-binding EF-hand superfamily protein
MGVMDFITGKVSRTAAFRAQCEAAFAEVDHNQSGTLDTVELHLAVMLFFDKLNAALPKKHVSPPTKSKVFEMFHEMDVDKSGELSEEEFLSLIQGLCRNVSNGVALDFFKGLVLVRAATARHL